MDIKKILELTEQNKIIEQLKLKSVEVPSWSDIETEYCPNKHPIVTDKKLRKDKRGERVARITYGLQKLVTRRMTQMAFSIPVNRLYNTGNDELKKKQAYAIEQIYKSARINTHNKSRFHAFFAACEFCTLWFPVKGQEHTRYGFKTKYELKCKTYSPMEKKLSRLEQSELYPLLDENGHMVAMSYEYTIESNGNEDRYFHTFTAGGQYKWRIVDGKWNRIDINPVLPIQKIPAVYISRPIPIWEDTSENVTEIELTLSQERDIIKKNSAPLVMISGKFVEGMAKKDDDSPREVYQLENNGSVQYVTWDQQIEAMQFMVETLKKNIDEELQLPNLSLENTKGLGAMSGEARKTLLTDAHLKVGEESGAIIELLEREFNVIKEFVAILNPEWKDSIHELDCEHVITPFTQNDETSTIDKYVKATGGKPVLSQRTAIQQTGLVDDAEAELKQIQSETAVENSITLFPTAE